MTLAARSAGTLFIVGMAIAVAIPTCALGQTGTDPDDKDPSRGVRIIDSPASAASPAPAPPAALPSPPAPTEQGMVVPVPTLTPSVAAPASPAAPPPLVSPAPGGVADLPPQPAPMGEPPTTASLDALSQSVNVANPAALELEIHPGPDIAVDSRVSFRATTKKAGYLILVDVDPTGKLTQIYPNTMSLMAKGNRGNSNFIKPGKSIQVPDPKDPTAGFEFVAAPPLGTAMVIGFLSDRPVQMIDLPDLPSKYLGSPAAADHLSEIANELKITDPTGKDALQDAHWSMSVRFYAIR